MTHIYMYMFALRIDRSLLLEMLLQMSLQIYVLWENKEAAARDPAILALTGSLIGLLYFILTKVSHQPIGELPRPLSHRCAQRPNAPTPQRPNAPTPQQLLLSCLIDDQFRGSRATKDLAFEHGFDKVDGGAMEDALLDGGAGEGGKGAGGDDGTGKEDAGSPADEGGYSVNGVVDTSMRLSSNAWVIADHAHVLR